MSLYENLKLIFDCYHIQINEGNLIGHFTEYLPYISHVQMAAVPDRNAPDHGEIAYERLIKAFQQIGYQGYFGAEYRAGVEVESTLAWLADFQRL